MKLMETERLIELYTEMLEENVFFHTGNYGLDGECDSVIISDGSNYGVFLDVDKVRTPMQELMAVSHEWGHYKTGAMYSINADPITRIKAERRADVAQIRRLLPKADLNAAMRDGRTSAWELADHFGLPESFVQTAIEYYRAREIH